MAGCRGCNAVATGSPARRESRARRLRARALPLGEALASARTEWPSQPTLTWWTLAGRGLVLGSGQPDEIVDLAAAAAADVEVARRASGGGAVLLVPGDVLWADLVIPRDHPRWDDDIVAGAGWVGDAWLEALVSVGVDRARLRRHQGGSVEGAWSKLVCFAGIGPGEVTLDGRKIVGLSQRRSRAGARFQMAVLLRWDPEMMLRLLALDPEWRATGAAALARVATGVEADAAALREAFAQQVC